MASDSPLMKVRCVKIHKSVDLQLRKLAFEQDTTPSALIREGLSLLLLNKTDIAK